MTLENSATTEPAPLVEVGNVSKWFGPLMALNDISLEIGPGITGLIGPNGAGKTTFLKPVSYTHLTLPTISRV